jgi:hypothetical protein
MEVIVRCYAGFKGEERPVSFDLEGRDLGVVEIERAWYEEGADEPGRRNARFRVRADDGNVYVLSREEASGRWTVGG